MPKITVGKKYILRNGEIIGPMKKTRGMAAGYYSGICSKHNTLRCYHPMNDGRWLCADNIKESPYDIISEYEDENQNVKLPDGSIISIEEIAKIVKVREELIYMRDKFFPASIGKIFISGVIGEIDCDGLPDAVTICPKYGSDSRASEIYYRKKDTD